MCVPDRKVYEFFKNFIQQRTSVLCVCLLDVTELHYKLLNRYALLVLLKVPIHTLFTI